MSTNHYSHFDYRTLIAWDKRLAREWAFLEKPFAAAPLRRVLDLGSGTGEHARFFAAKGFEVVGVDVSESQMDSALEAGETAGVRFIKGDVLHVDTVVDGQFGAAVCLGNTLSHFTEQDTLEQMFRALRRVLAPGAPFVLQILNYEHFMQAGHRSLPLTFIEDADGEAIFLRAMSFRPDGRVIFTPTLLRFRPDGTPAMEVETSHNVELHAWGRSAIDAALRASGFTDLQLFGTMANVPFDPAESHDLVIVAK